MSWLQSLAVDEPVVGDDLVKASPIQAATYVPPVEPRSYEFDPKYLYWSFMGDRPSDTHPGTAGLDYTTLYRMSRIPVIGALIQNRVNQIATFATRQKSRYGLGFRIKQRDETKNLSRRAARRIDLLEDMLLSAGGRYGPGGFEPFLRMLVRDSLIYDQCNFEVLFSNGSIKAGRPKIVGFVPVDAATIRRAKIGDAERDKGRMDRNKPQYVQVMNDKIINQYSYEELAWGVRRPRTDVHVNGYGYPELEELLKVITNLLNAETYNAVNFTNGVHASTILTLKSRMDQRAFTSFKRDVMSMMIGPRNAKRTPIVQLDPTRESGEDLKAVSLGQSNRDMEYSSWVNWMLKIAAAVYQIDPAEIGFVYGNEGGGNALNQRGPEERIAHSRDKGLRPLLRAVQSWINNWVIHPIDPDFTFEFVGFDVLSEERKIELDIKRVRSYMTINEVRAEHDLPPLDGPSGDLILDNVYSNAISKLAFDEIGALDPTTGDLSIPAPEDVAIPSAKAPDEDSRRMGEGTSFNRMTMSLEDGLEEAIKKGQLIKKDGGFKSGKRWILWQEDGDDHYHAKEIDP